MIATREKGISFQTVDLFTGIIPRRLVTPRMRRIFAIFEPTTFPRVISLFHFRLAVTLTVSSGRDVPNATTVKPMTRLDTPNRFAMDAEPETRKSAPFMRTTRPTIIKRRGIIM